MSVAFLQNTEWRQVTTPEWTVDHWGTDHCRIMWRGRSDKRIAFEDSLKRWDTMPGYSGMRLENWNGIFSSPSFPSVELRYLGFRSGTIPPTKITNGTSIQSAQGSGTDTGVDPNVEVSGNITYKANRTTYTWFETSAPNPTSRYDKVQIGTDPLEQIVSYSISDPNGKKRFVNYSAFVTIFNSLVRGNFVTDYVTEELIPGALWACRAEVDYKVIS